MAIFAGSRDFCADIDMVSLFGVSQQGSAKQGGHRRKYL